MPSDLPESIEMACLLLVQVEMRGGSIGIQSERVGDILVTYSSNDGEGLPKAVKALIAPFARRMV